MSAYRRLGRHAEGLAVYERCRNTLHAALGVKPSQETEVLRASLEAAGRALLTHNFRT
ncbi:MAG: BTAD domain-containing putative transcriptional regulator [Pseudomonadota bacterium]